MSQEKLQLPFDDFPFPCVSPSLPFNNNNRRSFLACVDECQPGFRLAVITSELDVKSPHMEVSLYLDTETITRSRWSSDARRSVGRTPCALVSTH